MNKILPISIIAVLLASYFVLSLTVFPTLYLSKELTHPQPFFEVNLSRDSINLGDSVELSVFSENIGDYGDIHILSVGFPSLQKIDDQVKILHSDFNHQYRTIETETMLGAKYSAGAEKLPSKYASIEIMNRPSPSKGHYTIDFSLTPKEVGPFEIYVKAIEIPHSSDLSHFPHQGILDPQGEYVSVYTIMVNP